MTYTRAASTVLDFSDPGGDVYEQGWEKNSDAIDNVITDLNTHEALTATHGVTGAVVGTTDSQTLTNKTLTNPSILGGVITGITDLSIADGGTGSSTAATARVGLGAMGKLAAVTNTTTRTNTSFETTLTTIYTTGTITFAEGEIYFVQGSLYGAKTGTNASVEIQLNSSSASLTNGVMTYRSLVPTATTATFAVAISGFFRATAAGTGAITLDARTDASGGTVNTIYATGGLHVVKLGV
jgi:hypothetical protein